VCVGGGQVLVVDRCHSLLLPFAAVGPHPHVNTAVEVVVGASSAYVLQRASPCGGGFGEDLHAYVRRRRRLAEREAAHLFTQALSAVAHCHRHSVVVRDVKLRRFLFADHDRCVLGGSRPPTSARFQDGARCSGKDLQKRKVFTA